MTEKFTPTFIEVNEFFELGSEGLNFPTVPNKLKFEDTVERFRHFLFSGFIAGFS